MSFSTVLTFDAASHFQFDDTLVEIASGHVQLVDLGGGTYSTANPKVETQFRIAAAALSSFAESKSVSGADEVKYTLEINGVEFWFDSSLGAWTSSNGTYSQANTAAEINSNVGTLVSDLSLTGNFYVKISAFLHSDDGTSNPQLTSVTVGYTFVTDSPDAIPECLISANLLDLLGEVPAYDASKPAQLSVQNDRAFLHSGYLVQPFTQVVNFNSSGYAEISVLETESVGEKLSFFVTFWVGRSKHSVKMINAVIPNAASKLLNEVTSVESVDYG